jgi:hypothetical protein
LIGTELVEIIIPESIGVIGERYFSECRSHLSVPFESGSRFLDVSQRAFFQVPVSRIISPNKDDFDESTEQCQTFHLIQFESWTVFLDE